MPRAVAVFAASIEHRRHYPGIATTNGAYNVDGHLRRKPEDSRRPIHRSDVSENSWAEPNAVGDNKSFIKTMLSVRGRSDGPVICSVVFANGDLIVSG